MRLLKFYLFQKYPKDFYQFIGLILLCAFSQFSILLAINLGIKSFTTGTVSLASVIALLIIAWPTLYFGFPAYYKQSEELISKIMLHIRQQISIHLLKNSLRKVEKLEPQKIQNLLIGTTTEILERHGFRSTILLNFTIIFITIFYTATISWKVFLVVTIIYAFSLYYFVKNGVHNLKFLKEANEQYVDQTNALYNILNGFKSLKLNSLKSEQSLEEYALHTRRTDQLYQKANRLNVSLIKEFEAAFFIFLFVLIILLTSLSLSAHQIILMMSTMLFIMPMFFNSFRFFNQLLLFKVLFEEVSDYYHQIQQETASLEDEKFRKNILLKKGIELKNISFTYDLSQPNAYQFGPVNLHIRKGELIFIVGSNGSGKSTLMKLLTGMYTPTQGQIQFDGELVTAYSLADYHSLFSIIFTDFHLFDRLYGIQKINEEHIDYLLNLMELDKATAFVAQQFTNLSLSSGQKKRMAMLAAFVENKSVYILDEVAADQDPGYRKFFYYTVLPELKKAGKTIVVVSHDEHYFHIADRVVYMENGKIQKIDKAAKK